ncbi:Aste57867_23348 [Aphanomyces stellatus]|uniref:Aste57867_23348 protein n=1 Tax=Aphanomyces stellatus TaxID=120398 RepID=A0A485LMJ1_9STRA|nr:hypothetical protein As57867_023277 [Aphanomyces stellatus]VFT99993.1 Aste57867_23348 [Aphanomyces stellatus]
MRGRGIYAWGSGGAGQLGTRDELDYAVPRPISVLGSLDDDVDATRRMEVVSGGCHSAGLTAHGQLYTWGEGKHGQLGYAVVAAPTTTSQLAPRHVEGTSLVRTVACGWWHTIAVMEEATSSDSKTSHVHGWGHGHVPAFDRVHSLLRTFPMAISSVSCGWKHSLLATTDGHVYAWGRGRHGELALGSSIHEAARPAPVEGLPPTARVFCGWQHSVFLTTAGEVWSSGSNKHGQLGTGPVAVAYTPARVDTWQGATDRDRSETAAAVVDMAVGWHHVVCVVNLVRKAVVYSWGKGDLGQLGHGEWTSEALPRPLRQLDDVIQVACGSEHTLLVTALGQVYSCGWGEHGNLGHDATVNVARPTAIAYFDDRNIRVTRCSAAGAVSLAVSIGDST